MPALCAGDRNRARNSFWARVAWAEAAANPGAMSPQEITDIARHYASAGAWDRFHVKQRLRFFPHDVLLPHLPERGSLLDIGCGFGLLGWYLAGQRPGLSYYGADIDVHKVELAKASFAARPNATSTVHLHAGDVMQWAERPASFTVVAILDVLLLLPMELQREMFEFACRSLDPGPEARLVLKIQPFMRGKALVRTWIQENIMVNILRKTKTSGALHFRQDPALYVGWGKEHGFSTQEIELPTYPPSTLLVMRRG
jgi:2-polyprenyl-3-methyl-5-hydroxy-6-metoxy-1,4-benzoquinol methylase